MPKQTTPTHKEAAPAARVKNPIMEGFVANPLLVEPGLLPQVESLVLHAFAEKPELFHEGASTQHDYDFWGVPGQEAHYRPYKVSGGILQIPVQGVLLHRFPYAYGRWATGYAYIEKALKRGLEDPAVLGIALIVDSPGGEVAGCFELADKIYEARGRKPIRAFASDHAFSAAYALASSASDIVVTRSGGTGSVGVVTAHYDWSKALEDYGLKVTFIFAGAHKVDGNSYEPLPESVKERIQERIDGIYSTFTGTVARNRGLEESAVRATEALTYDARGSLEIGFADREGALEEEMVTFAGEVAETEDKDMPNENPSASASEGQFTQAQVDALVSTARAEAETASRARITAILASDEGKDRPKAAMSLALKTNLSADEVKATLADMPKEAAQTQASGTPFEGAMGNTPNPNVGAEGGKDDTKMSVPDSIFASAGFAPLKN